jgi:hypothetical protein
MKHKTELETVIKLSSIRVQLSFVLLVITKVIFNENRKNNTKSVNSIMKNETRGLEGHVSSVMTSLLTRRH